MEINGNNSTVGVISYINRAAESTKQESTKTEDTAGQSKGGDKVELSDQAKEANRAFAELKKLPEIREEKVGKIQAQIETDTYKVENEKIAVSMLNESIENNLILNAIDLEV